MSIRISELDPVSLPVNPESLIEISELEDGYYNSKQMTLSQLISSTSISFRFPISFTSNDFGDDVLIYGPHISEIEDAFGVEILDTSASISAHLSATLISSDGTLFTGSSINNIIYNSQGNSTTSYIASDGRHEIGHIMPVPPPIEIIADTLIPIVTDVDIDIYGTILIRVFIGSVESPNYAFNANVQGFIDVTLPAFIRGE